MARARSACLALVALLAPTIAGAERLPVEVRARLSAEAPQIEGTVTWHWPAGERPERMQVLFRFGHRFTAAPAWNELSRHFLLAGGTFRPGDTEILEARAGERELVLHRVTGGGLPEGSLAALDLGADPPTDGETGVTVRFRTTLPNLRDVFGAAEGVWLAIDGWHPVMLSDWEAAVRAPARYELELPEEGEVLAGGAVREGAGAPVTIDAPDGRLPLAWSREPFGETRLRVGERPVAVFSASEPEWKHRISRHPQAREALLDALGRILERASGANGVTVLRAPLRWLPATATPGLVVVPDRLFGIHPLLRLLHERELAYAVFLHEELRRAAGRGDPRWVAEGLAWRRAQAFYEERLRAGRDVRDWIRLFDLFAIVDRFETAPRVPWVRTFFPTLPSDDPLGLRPESVAGDRPPGRVLFAKLEARLGAGAFGRVLERTDRGEPFVEGLRTEGGAEIEAFTAAWLRPAPRWNYALEQVTRNPDGENGAAFLLRREGRDRRPDAVEIELETAAGPERFFLDVDHAETPVRFRTRAPVEAVRLDPDRRGIQTRLDDDRVPGSFHFLLDSADVEVSSTEFGFSTLLVARRRYDYRKDLAAAPFVTNRSLGVNVGAQLHGGAPIDDNLFRHNLFGFFSFQELDADFRGEDDRLPRTSGSLTGFGLRYNRFDAFWFENPSDATHVRLFADVFDSSLGGDYDYLQAGGSLSAAFSLRPDTVLALEVVNGFDVETGGAGIPNQGLFSLGGFRSIRGIGAEERLAENLFVVRAELRRLLPVRLDLDFEEMLVARRLQLRTYLDAGRVDDHRSRVYDPEGFAVGAGVGLNLFYEFLGFFPSSFYVDVATRVDRDPGAEILFGARQPF